VDAKKDGGVFSTAFVFAVVTKHGQVAHERRRDAGGNCFSRAPGGQAYEAFEHWT
jgi:hypothetical protein